MNIASPPIPRMGLWTYALDVVPRDQAVELARTVESLGYGIIWMPDIFSRDPLVSSAIWLSETTKLSFATGIVSIYGRAPGAMAAAWKTLSDAFPGRFVLGLGVSHAPLVEGIFRREYTRPLAEMRGYLDGMDTAPAAGITPPVPARRVLAALGPRMLDLAAEKADGAHPYLVTPEHTVFARERLGPDKILAPEQAVVVETDVEEARRIGRMYLATYLSLPNYVNNLRRLGFTDEDFAGGGSDRLVDGIVARGDVEAIAARVRAHHDAGADHVAVQVLTAEPGTVPLDQWRSLAPALRS
jgi:probable F420-dependent oxidoreductase